MSYGIFTVSRRIIGVSYGIFIVSYIIFGVAYGIFNVSYIIFGVSYGIFTVSHNAEIVSHIVWMCVGLFGPVYHIKKAFPFLYIPINYTFFSCLFMVFFMFRNHQMQNDFKNIKQ